MPERAYVYILAHKRNGTLYTGVASNLEKRVIEHKTKVGFTHNPMCGARIQESGVRIQNIF